MNTSFRAEDGLQLLQMVAHGSRYESASICELVNSSIIMHELGKVADNGKDKG